MLRIVCGHRFGRVNLYIKVMRNFNKSIDCHIDVARIFVIRHFIYCNVNYLILMLFSLFVVIAVIMRFHQIYIFTVNLFLLRRVLRRVTKSVVEDLSFSFFNSIIPSTIISTVSV